MRCIVSRTCASLTMPWCSQLAMCWLEMRSVARSSISADVVDVRHLGAADALVDPAHDIAEDALRVVVELALDLLGRPVRRDRQRRRQDRVEQRARRVRRSPLPRADVDLVVVDRVQRRRGRRRHPRRVRAGLRMRDLLRQHRRPSRRAWPTCPCRSARVPAGRTRGRCRRSGPRTPRSTCCVAHLRLADHGPGFHAGVDLVAGAIEEAGVDEEHARSRRADAFLEVDGGAPLLVHDADLERVARRDRARPRPSRTASSAKATSSGPCIFGLTM